ncbi:hypothetical protein ACROYT_G003924 [Oculina patagonica]
MWKPEIFLVLCHFADDVKEKPKQPSLGNSPNNRVNRIRLTVRSRGKLKTRRKLWEKRFKEKKKAERLRVRERELGHQANQCPRREAYRVGFPQLGRDAESNADGEEAQVNAEAGSQSLFSDEYSSNPEGLGDDSIPASPANAAPVYFSQDVRDNQLDELDSQSHSQSILQNCAAGGVAEIVASASANVGNSSIEMQNISNEIQSNSNESKQSISSKQKQSNGSRVMQSNGSKEKQSNEKQSNDKQNNGKQSKVKGKHDNAKGNKSNAKENPSNVRQKPSNVQQSNVNTVQSNANGNVESFDLTKDDGNGQISGDGQISGNGQIGSGEIVEVNYYGSAVQSDGPSPDANDSEMVEQSSLRKRTSAVLSDDSSSENSSGGPWLLSTGRGSMRSRVPVKKAPIPASKRHIPAGVASAASLATGRASSSSQS